MKRYDFRQIKKRERGKEYENKKEMRQGRG